VQANSLGAKGCGKGVAEFRRSSKIKRLAHQNIDKQV
jgi:hypothetical protein